MILYSGQKFNVLFNLSSGLGIEFNVAVYWKSKQKQQKSCSDSQLLNIAHA